MVLDDTLRLLLFAGGLGALLLANFVSSRLYLAIAGFLLPLASLSYNIGVNLFFHSLLGAFSFATLPFAVRRPPNPAKTPYVALLLLYAGLVSVAWMLAEYLALRRYLTAEALGFGPGQTLFRMPVQLFSFATAVMAIRIVPSRARTLADLNWALKGYIAGLSVSVLAGLVMIATTGVGMVTSDENQVLIGLGGETVSRLGGLSGEPRHLGGFLLFMLSLGASVVLQGTRRRTGIALLTAVILASIFLTYSTSTWIGFGLATLVLLGAVFRRADPGRWATVVLVVGGLAAVAALSPFIQAAYEARIERRILEPDADGLETQKDSYLLDVFAESPLSFVFGYGLGGFDLEALPHAEMPRYRDASLPTPTSTAGRILGDLGIVGLGIFSWMVWRWYRRLRDTAPSLALALLSSFAGLLAVSMLVLPAFLFLAGIALSYQNLQRRGCDPEASTVDGGTIVRKPAPTV